LITRKLDLASLLQECADALYYVYECGDGFQFNLSKYEELALRCNEVAKRLSGQTLQDALVKEVLKDYAEVKAE